MRSSIHPARLTRSWRAHLLAAALLLSVVSVAGCTGSSGTTAHRAATASGAATQARVVLDCLLPPASCYAPHVFQVAYAIQPLLNRGIDGRGETVTVLEPGPSSAAPITLPPGVIVRPGQVPPASPVSHPAGTWVRRVTVERVFDWARWQEQAQK
ncbi:MAG: hypothetical protein ACRDOA_20045 [Streptosporangiaceae bacterium]